MPRRTDLSHVLVIGSGTGGTPYAAGLHPGTERVRVIEIVAPVIGTLTAGRVGGVAAWLGFTMPSAIILVALALLTAPADLAELGWVQGLKLAAVAVVAQAK